MYLPGDPLPEVVSYRPGAPSTLAASGILRNLSPAAKFTLRVPAHETDLFLTVFAE